jgi:hypothetical protein
LRAIQGFKPKEQLIGPMEESEGSFSIQVNFVEPEKMFCDLFPDASQTVPDRAAGNGENGVECSPR